MDPFGQNIVCNAGEPFKIKIPFKGNPKPTATFYNVSDFPSYSLSIKF